MRFCVVSFVEDAPEEFGREAWPLHVTWVPPFDADEAEAVEAFTRAAESRAPAATEAVGEEWFGSRHDVRVTELARTADLDALHRALLGALADAGVDVARMRHVRDAFRPHVSAQGGRALRVGTRVTLDEVSLVSLRPDDDPRRRRVVLTRPLG